MSINVKVNQNNNKNTNKSNKTKTKKELVKVAVQKANSQRKILNSLEALTVLIQSEPININYLVSFLIQNSEFKGACIIDKNKLLVPLDLKENKIAVRFQNYNIGLSGGCILYIINKDLMSYTKYEIIKGEEGKLELKNKERVEKVQSYNVVKERIIERFNIKLPKNMELKNLQNRLRAQYITRLDKDIVDIAKENGYTLEEFMTIVGNPSRSNEGEEGLYRAYQQRVVKDYNEGLSIQDIYKKYDTSKSPVLRAIKEHNYLITDAKKMEDLIIRSFGEGMLPSEIGRYIKPIERGFYTKESFRELQDRVWERDLSKSKHLSPSEVIAIRLYRSGVKLEDLVNAVQREQGREESEDRYWRAYTRLLIGLTRGKNGLVLNFEEASRVGKEVLYMTDNKESFN